MDEISNSDKEEFYILAKSMKTTTTLVAAIALVACVALIIAMPSDAEDTDEYKFYLYNTVDGEDSTINGWYSGNGDTVVAAFCNALDKAEIKYTGFSAEDSSLFFSSSKSISDWTTSYTPDGDYSMREYSVWNYNEENGWYLGNTFGTDSDKVYAICHENYINAYSETAELMGIKWNYPDPSEYGLVYDGTTGNYANLLDATKAWFRAYLSDYMTDIEDFGISYDEDYDGDDDETTWATDVKYDSAIGGWNTSYITWGYANLAPIDLNANPDDVKFGPNKYQFQLINTIEDESYDYDGWYSAYGTNAADAFVNALSLGNVPNTVTINDEGKIWINSGDIADWTSSWNSSADDVIGHNYALWNYNDENGWFQAGSLGEDSDLIYTIIHEDYYQPTGETATYGFGVSMNPDATYAYPTGFYVNPYGWAYSAPQDYSATPDKVVFGIDWEKFQSYDFILMNFVENEDSEINGTYSGLGATPVEALVNALNTAGVKHTIDFKAKSIWFETNSISTWTSSWDSSAADVLGANYAIWNYSEEKGWFTGNTFGSDPETTYLISHENYYQPAGETAVKYGVKANADGTYSAPVGLAVPYAFYVQYAPIDATATPEDLIFGKVAGIDFVASIEVDGKTVYYETLADANKATDGTLIKVIGNVSNDASLSLKKDMEIVSGVTVTATKAITVAKNKVLTIDEGAKVILSGGNLSNSGTVNINGVVETSKNNLAGKGDYNGMENVVINSYYAVGDTGSFTGGAGTTTHKASSDAAKYLADSQVALTYTIVSVPGAGNGSWDNYGTVTISEITFKDAATIVYIPSYVVSKITVGEDTILGYYKVTALSDDVIKAINEKSIRVILPAALQTTSFESTVDVSNITYYTDADGNVVYYHVDETTPIWMSGYATYTMYTKAEEPDAKYCEQGTIIGVKFADGQTTFGKKTVNWATNDTVSSDEYVSGSWADMTAAVMVADICKEYTFVLNNTVDGENSKINGTYTAYASTAVRALSIALETAGIENTVDASAATMWFANGTIADWTSSWDSTATDILGANYAVWNYSEEKGWFIGNTFGKDSETVYYISHENYFTPTGATAKANGVAQFADGSYFAPTGLLVQYGMYVQLAPQDLGATLDTVKFGPVELTNYTFILKNTVYGQNSEINGTYTAVAENPVKALYIALNVAGIENTIDPTAASIWFATGTIADWASEWDSSATELLGANYAVWNYSEEKGWFIGNSLGADSETTYLVSHENYYAPTGQVAKAMGIVANDDGTYTAPEGLVVSWGMYVQIAPADASATPDNLVFEPRYVLTVYFYEGMDALIVAGYVGTEIPVVSEPVREGFEFLQWSSDIPATMPEYGMFITAIWGIAPVVTDTEIDVDTSETGYAQIPETTDGKKLEVDMGTGTVIIANSDALAGKVIYANAEVVENTSSVEGTAYEFNFEADGEKYTGSMQVTLPYQYQKGKEAVVYFVDGDNVVKMTVVATTNDTVTFETDHNSTYVVASETPEKVESSDMSAMLIVILVVIVASVAIVAVADRKKD